MAGTLSLKEYKKDCVAICQRGGNCAALEEGGIVCYGDTTGHGWDKFDWESHGTSLIILASLGMVTVLCLIANFYLFARRRRDRDVVLGARTVRAGGSSGTSSRFGPDWYQAHAAAKRLSLAEPEGRCSSPPQYLPRTEGDEGSNFQTPGAEFTSTRQTIVEEEHSA